ncbi:hypothetical protein TEA_002807 [Camellia sinensis var. sinensis]|uniref:1,3-beta-glucan synthase n=1 Tax=Camellia sinensis var. sinensis TaxID=542762 RepID=A0A4S4DF94_CAMSN|nr:hypothetical protein TEA_002807 [Camellia sinensis var. sinensis]
MASEIVVAEPTNEGTSSSSSSGYRRGYISRNTRPFTRSITSGHDRVPELFDSEKLPVTLVSEIQRFLRVANWIQIEEPRAAYLCRFHAFEVAHNLDRNSNGRGVRQFKTSLLQRLEQDEEFTIRKRKEKSDIRELKRVYHKYREYIIKHVGDCNLENRENKARAIASALFEVLCTVSKAAGLQALADKDSAKSELFVPYNILPLDQGGVHHAITQLPEIKAAVFAVRNVRGLPFLEDFKKRMVYLDLFDWLQFCFGFQKGNVANQREHLILLLANTHIRKIPKQTNVSQMAYELHGILNSDISMITGERVMPAYGGQSESFLNNVVSPIYTVIQKEAMKNKNGTADHSTWRNYDDLNEYFWSPDCFEIGWPMRLDHNFFCVQQSDNRKVRKARESVKNLQEKKREQNENEVDVEATTDEKLEQIWLGKTNFVEVRSFWHIFRSFDRMWSFFILSLQAMIIMASHDLESPLQVFDATILEDVMSIFITSAVLKLIQAILDIVFTWKARSTMHSSQTLKHVLKVGVAVIWTIVLPVCYAGSRRKYTCYTTDYHSWLGEWCYSPYMVAVTFYLMTNAVDMVLFFVPLVGRYVETSNCRMGTFLSWWTQAYLCSKHRDVALATSSLVNRQTIHLVSQSVVFIVLDSSNFKCPPNSVKSNAGAIAAIWAPIILVYFMDPQIWYSVFCSIFGGVYGILHHLGEIRTLGMLRSRFQSLPSAFSACLVPPPSSNEKDAKKKSFFQQRFQKVSENEKNGIVKFVLVWNQIISSFREEDVISNREMDLMKIPLSSELFSGVIRWPVFLLANKFSTALSIATDFVGKDGNLHRKIRKDNNMYCAVKECYELLKYILEILVVANNSIPAMHFKLLTCFSSLVALLLRIISGIFDEIEGNIERSSLLENFKMSELPSLQYKCVELVELLVEGNGDHRNKVVKALQDIFELVTYNMMANGSRILDSLYSEQEIEVEETEFFGHIEPELFASNHSIHFPLPDTGLMNEQIKRFLLLLTVKDTAMDIPSNLEARRRISFFATSLFMNIPSAPKIKRFLLLLTVKDTAMDIPSNLEARRRISFFATSLFMNIPSAPKVRNMLSFSVLTPHFTEEVIFSAKEISSSKEEVSINFYMQKIYPDEWKNFLERMRIENLDGSKVETDAEVLKDHRNWTSFRGQTLSRTVRGMMYYREALKLQAFLDMAEDEDILQGYDAIDRRNDTLSAQLDALADMKFTYVISCQMFGSQKSAGDPQAQDILDLMIRYPSLRVAYVEEKEEIVENKPVKVYSSVLVKAVNGFDQDNYMEEAFKMRNVLQEFLQHQGRPPTILGLREHIFTGSVSSLAWFMSYQETSFVTIGQRLLANPLRVRFHYGHPDLFDRVFHLTRGGISKASKTINLSEDVFAGFNSTLRRGYVTYHEYMQVGKGRDVGLNQISKFEAKVANGNSEQTLSRDIYRLGRRFDFFRMLSCYFTTIGFYFNSLISVIGIYVFLYGQLYLVLSGLERAFLQARIHNIQSLETALASQSFIQLGLLTGLPMVMEIGLERGFLNAAKDFVLMQLQLAAVFFTFSLGTKAHYYGRTILHGGAKYRPTGRKVVVFHASFTENYRLYSRSHFVKGFELLLLLVVYDLFRRSYQNNMAYVLVTYAIWFMSLTWLFAPFFFNPSGFDWGKIVDDWKDWNKWINQQGGIGIQEDKSWQSWWNDEQAHLRHSRLSSRLIEILLSLRFFIYQYGLVYHLDISGKSKNFIVYVLSWVVIVFIFLLVKAVNMGRRLLSANHQLTFRLFKAFLFLGVLSTIFTLSLACKLSLKDLIVCCLAFFPTGWGLILAAQAVRPKIKDTALWNFTEVFAQAYDYGMGVVLFAPMAALAWLPIISSFQTRFLFNEAFSRRLQIQLILAGKKKRT